MMNLNRLRKRGKEASVNQGRNYRNINQERDYQTISLVHLTINHLINHLHKIKIMNFIKNKNIQLFYKFSINLIEQVQKAENAISNNNKKMTNCNLKINKRQEWLIYRICKARTHQNWQEMNRWTTDFAKKINMLNKNRLLV